MASTARNPAPNQADPMYAVAMLRIAMELKKSNPQHVDDIVEGVLERMQLDKLAFRRYLDENLGLLLATATAKGF